MTNVENICRTHRCRGASRGAGNERTMPMKREVLLHIPDAWIDHSKTKKGYEISFTRYFYDYVPPRSIEEITAEILQLEKETDGILNEIVNA